MNDYDNDCNDDSLGMRFVIFLILLVYSVISEQYIIVYEIIRYILLTVWSICVHWGPTVQSPTVKEKHIWLSAKYYVQNLLKPTLRQLDYVDQNKLI